jgi:hypothetical protein
MKSLLCFFMLLLSGLSIAQEDTLHFFQASPQRNLKRLQTVVGGELLAGGGSLVVLGTAWYKDYPRTTFHTFDDNREWLQMDKAGHAVTAYTLGRYGIGLMKWAGATRKRNMVYGGLLGFTYLGVVEIFDGFSSGWGFSSGDLFANAFGTGCVIGQELLWNEQRITLKYNFRKTRYAQYRPVLLGRSVAEQWLKDYNGQTYWLSFNLASFFSQQTKIPSWLNLAIGYGANGMTGGHENPAYSLSNGTQLSFARYRQYYLSFDIDLTQLPIESPFWKAFVGTFGFLKIPSPALVLEQGRVRASILE